MIAFILGLFLAFSALIPRLHVIYHDNGHALDLSAVQLILGIILILYFAISTVRSEKK